MLFSSGIVNSNAELSHSIVFLNWIVFFYIVLCSSVLDYDLLHCVMRNQIMLTVAITQFCSLPCFMAFLSDRIVLCFSVLSYGKVIYAYVISCMALSVQNLDDWARARNGSNVSKWRTRMTKILRLSIKGLRGETLNYQFVSKAGF